MKRELASLIKFTLCLISLLLLPQAKAAGNYELTIIPDLAFPEGLSDDGTTVVGATANWQAAIWQKNQGMTYLQTGFCWDISGNGKIVGAMINPADNIEEAFVYQNGSVTYLGNLATGSDCESWRSAGWNISYDGSTVVGAGWKSNWTTEAYYKPDGQPMVGLGQDQNRSSRAQAVNGNGTLFGGWNEDSVGARRGVIWNTVGERIWLSSFNPDWPDNEVTAFNIAGTKAVGFCSSADNSIQAYIWSPSSGMSGIYGTTTKKSYALDIADNNTVAGNITTSWLGNRAAIRTDETGVLVDLKSYLAEKGFPGLEDWTLTNGNQISRDGSTICGTGISPEGVYSTFIAKLGDTGSLAGHVTLNGTVGSVKDVILKVAGKYIHPDAAGNFYTIAQSGTHKIEASIFGYNSVTVNNIAVAAGNTSGGIELTLNPAPEPINQIRNLTVDKNNAIVNWDAPQAGYNTFLRYGDGINFDGLGAGGGEMIIGTRWPVTLLKNYSGAKISQIRFYPRNNTCSYKVKVWSGEAADSMLYEKPVENVIANQWNYVSIDQPLVIDGTENILISLEIGACAGIPAGYAQGPSTYMYSDLIFMDGAWVSMMDLGYDLNWNLEAQLTDSQNRVVNIENSDIKSFAPSANCLKYNEKFNRISQGNKKSAKPVFITLGNRNDCQDGSRPVVSYKIYLNNQVVASGVATTEYQLTGLTPNTTYTTGVAAVYANGSESEIVSQTFIYQKASVHLNPVELNVTSSNVVSWGMPANWFDFCADENADAIGDPAGDFAAAIRFTPDQLADYTNTKISKISFYPRSAATTYTLKIWNGNNGETELYSQPITNVTVDQWNEVTLTTPQAIDVTKDLYVGYLVSNQLPDSNSAGTDAGPAIIGNGDMVKMINMGWTELADWGLNKNWNLRAYIEVQSGKVAELKVTSNGNEAVKPAKKSTLVNSNTASKSGSKAQNLTGYHVYLNNMTTPIATVTGNSYQLTNLSATNTVGIQAVYNDGVSEIVTKSFTGITDNNTPAVTELKGNYPNPFNPATSINFSVAKTENIRISVYNANGQIVKELLNSKMAAGNYQVNFDASAYNSGIYYAVMESESGVKMTKKMVLLK